MSYAEFLARKRLAVIDHGREVDPSELHSSLFGFQRSVTTWALRKGRAAIFLDTGMGKTRIQVEWARLSADRSLIVAPLSVARQTVREAATGLGVEVRYVRSPDAVDGPGIYATNYELADRFDPAAFGAVVLDESSILKNVAGKMRERLTESFRCVPYRLACTATPAPNDVAELCNHAEYLGAASRSEMLAAYFIHDDDGWRLKGHAAESMYRFVGSWAVAARRPSDLGYEDEGFDLPPLTILPVVVDGELTADGQFFATELGGVGGRHKVRRQTLDIRVARAVELCADDEQWIVWCGLNEEASTIAAAVDGAVNVPGSWSPDDKAVALESFQDGATRVLVTKPTIAGYGMNFQNCHKMIFLGLSDSYEQYYQAIRRCYRFGQMRPVEAYVIVSEIEQQIVENVRAKEAEAARLTDALVRLITSERTAA